MSIPRLLLLTWVIAFCATRALAQQPVQSAPARNHFSGPSLFGTPAPAQDLHTQTPIFHLIAPTSLRTQTLPAFDKHTVARLAPFMELRQRVLIAQNEANRAELQFQVQNSSTCYAIRDYQFQQDDDVSGATHLSGYSTCVPRAGIQMKEARSAPARGPVLIR